MVVHFRHSRSPPGSQRGANSSEDFVTPAIPPKAARRRSSSKTLVAFLPLVIALLFAGIQPRFVAPEKAVSINNDTLVPASSTGSSLPPKEVASVEHGKVITKITTISSPEGSAGEEGRNGTKVWISLSLCSDSNRVDLERKGLPHKAGFPYEEAAISAVALWSTVAGAEVIVAVVANNAAAAGAGEGPDPRPPDVVARLRGAGAAAVRVVRPDPDLGCVTESQLQRLYAYEHEDVHDDDIVVTADVDSFPTSPAVLDPLLDRSYSTWMWQWPYAEQTGNSFPISFIGMRAALWRNVTSHLWDGLEKSNNWNNDQLLLSRVILKLRLCSVTNMKMWKRTNVKYHPFNDTGVCFHGSTRHAHGVVGRWGWVHFTPGHNSSDIAAITKLIYEYHNRGTKRRADRKAFVQELAALWETNKKVKVVTLPVATAADEGKKTKLLRAKTSFVAKREAVS